MCHLCVIFITIHFVHSVLVSSLMMFEATITVWIDARTQHDFKSIPIAFETYGYDFMVISQCGNDRSGSFHDMSRSVLKNYWMKRLSAAIQIGQAMLLKNSKLYRYSYIIPKRVFRSHWMDLFHLIRCPFVLSLYIFGAVLYAVSAWTEAIWFFESFL